MTVAWASQAGAEPGSPVYHFIGCYAQHHCAGSVSAKWRHLQSNLSMFQLGLWRVWLHRRLFSPSAWDQACGLNAKQSWGSRDIAVIPALGKLDEHLEASPGDMRPVLSPKGETAEWWRARSVLSENTGSVSSTHKVAPNCLYFLFHRILHPYGFYGTGNTWSVHILIQMKMRSKNNQILKKERWNLVKKKKGREMEKGRDILHTESWAQHIVS